MAEVAAMAAVAVAAVVAAAAAMVAAAVVAADATNSRTDKKQEARLLESLIRFLIVDAILFLADKAHEKLEILDGN